MKYNILMEKWLPMSDGQKYALMECLEHAHELERISCSSPLETYALHRFLCAFVMDALQLPNKAARMALLQQGHFDMTVFDSYTKACEAEGVSFDLFDEKRPFMQAGYDDGIDTIDKPASVIMADVPSGNNHVFLEHRMADDHCLAPNAAMIKLLSSYVFCTAAAQGYPSSVNNTPCLYVVVHGGNLFETIVLGCISQKEAGNLPYGKPAWRSNASVTPKKEFASVDLLQGLTWQPRRLTLIDGTDDLIYRVYYSQGHSFKGNSLWRDPHVPYRLLKDGTFSSVKPASGRSLWRDLGGLAVSKENRYGKQPQIIAALPDDWSMCKITVTGLITNQATLVDTICEEMLIPSNILNDEEHGDVLHRDLDFVEAIHRAIGKAFADSVAKPVAEDMQNGFLASVRDYLFASYFEELSYCETDADYVVLQENVEKNLLRCVYNMLERLSLRMGHDANNIVLQSTIQRNILNAYYKLWRERSNE